MIGITIETHTTKAIANEVGAGGSAGPPPRPRDLGSVVVVPDEATPLFFNVPGLTRGESAMLSEGTGTSTVASAGWAQGGGAELRRRQVGSGGAHVLGCQRCDEWRAPAEYGETAGACPKGPVAARETRKDRLQHERTGYTGRAVNQPTSVSEVGCLCVTPCVTFG